MNAKSEILRALTESGSFVSGAELAKKLGVSRTAVWKTVEQLKSEGFAVEAVRNRGYRLLPGGDALTAESISALLHTDCRVVVLPRVDSTNEACKKLAGEGAPEWTVVTAPEQTAGRGRLGRSFFSPPGTGVYLSILLRPRLAPEQTFYITTAAAAAVAEALEDCGCKDARIKWVNDVYVRGKKVCGILTEGAFDVESGHLSYAVLGIGVNLTEPPGGFGELADKVGAAFTDRTVTRSCLIARIIDRFAAYYADLASKPHLEAYRARDFLTGTDVTVLSGGTERTARVLGIDDEFRLCVQYDDGSTSLLSTGEVSIRPEIHDFT